MPLNTTHWLAEAAKTAMGSQCLRRRCGTVIVKDGIIIGQGFNGLPGGPGQSCVHCQPYALSPAFKSDKACCIHAEQRAVMDALRGGHLLDGSTLYFSSVDADGMPLKSGQPYCTICSKMALDAGVAQWVLDHEDGVRVYDAADYNQLSFAYAGEGA